MIKYRSGYKYHLIEDAYFYLPSLFPDLSIKTEFISVNERVMRIKAGYAWDGPSGPTLDTKDAMRASLVHDAGYQLMREGFIDRAYKKDFDRLLHDIGIEDGMNSIRAWIWEKAVNRYGLSAVIKNKDILVAP